MQVGMKGGTQLEVEGAILSMYRSTSFQTELWGTATSTLSIVQGKPFNHLGLQSTGQLLRDGALGRSFGLVLAMLVAINKLSTSYTVQIEDTIPS